MRIDTARTDPPAAMAGWLREHFGSVEAVREQTVVRLLDRVTLEGTVFAPLRSQRPIDGADETDERRLRDAIVATRGDPFCSPLESTPAAGWGRVSGGSAVSGANAAAYDAEHGVLVFSEHDPLAFDVESVSDLLALGRRWADAARAEAHPEADRYLFLWNCLWRAGGSIIHGHAQVLLGHGRHHARLERWRRDAAAYTAATGRGYLDDLVAIHRDLGLALTLPGATLLASLTPVKERELWLVADAGVDDASTAFREAAGRTAVAYRDALGVRSFNLALWRPPLGATWPELRPIIRLVDRGAPFVRPSDIGAMELFATPIVGSDPFEVAAAVRGSLGGA